MKFEGENFSLQKEMSSTNLFLIYCSVGRNHFCAISYGVYYVTGYYKKSGRVN